MEKSEDEKMAEALKPKAAPQTVTPASQSKETVIEDEKANELAPKPTHWLLEAHQGGSHG